jgi:hypothetical protein
MKFKMQDLLDIDLDNAEKLKKKKKIINKIFKLLNKIKKIIKIYNLSILYSLN